MWDAWHTITESADPFLDALTTERLLTFLEYKGKPVDESTGTLLRRCTYHYWYHTGETHAVRDMLGHAGLPEFVGDMSQASYRPEA
jgi:hypothetical protein